MGSQIYTPRHPRALAMQLAMPSKYLHTSPRSLNVSPSTYGGLEEMPPQRCPITSHQYPAGRHRIREAACFGFFELDRFLAQLHGLRSIRPKIRFGGDERKARASAELVLPEVMTRE